MKRNDPSNNNDTNSNDDIPPQPTIITKIGSIIGNLQRVVYHYQMEAQVGKIHYQIQHVHPI